MDAKRTPRGQIDQGDRAYGSSVIEAARYVLDGCVKPRGRSGYATQFSDNKRLKIQFSSFASRLPYIHCDPSPFAPITDDVKQKVIRALLRLPTSEKVTTFNYTRAQGPAGTKVVTYLLPRTEPADEEPPVLRVDMYGDVVTAAPWWDIWTAGVAIYNACIRQGKQGFAWNLVSQSPIIEVMSLYYEAASFLVSPQDSSGSLKSRVFGSKSLKSTPKQVYALVAEASKWSPILSEVIEKSQLMQHERKLSPSLATLLVHDLLLSKSGVAAPDTHPLRTAVTRHRARLSAELTKLRIRKGFSSLEEFGQYINGDQSAPPSLTTDEVRESSGSMPEPKKWSRPRWVRVNTLKCTLKDQLQTTFADYDEGSSLESILSAHPKQKLYHVDKHVPNLLALTSGTDLTPTAAYKNGHIILQDKASCFPAYLLNPQTEDGLCLDACAAPGNKTTHLAAILQSQSPDPLKHRVWACERDMTRAEILKSMVHLAGCDDMITINTGQDFLLIDPENTPWNKVGCLLLDPSCSGSGMHGRNESLPVTLPVIRASDHIPMKSKKRKRREATDSKPASKTVPDELIKDTSRTKANGSALPVNEHEQLSKRLQALHKFQLELLLHAFRFPYARKISYSTCSIHAEENENVVIAALRSGIAAERGWRLLRRDEQVMGMKSWPIRGEVQACRNLLGDDGTSPEETAQACIRCNIGTEEGTQGFFVAAFIREYDGNHVNKSQAAELYENNAKTLGTSNHVYTEADWDGLSDSD
ncbi:MAG: hypothetical protein Q9220_004341 [cf. Caloplaca sp. 1 TL-2023]